MLVGRLDRLGERDLHPTVASEPVPDADDREADDVIITGRKVHDVALRRLLALEGSRAPMCRYRTSLSLSYCA
jgi:hypothetical protein